jgi:hypothetical protein
VQNLEIELFHLGHCVFFSSKVLFENFLLLADSTLTHRVFQGGSTKKGKKVKELKKIQRSQRSITEKYHREVSQRSITEKYHREVSQRSITEKY